MRRLLLGLVLLLAAPSPPRAQEPALTVFAAASLQDALKALEPAWRAAAAGNPPLRFSFAASSTLARQMEQGAPADLFMSADEQWMDWAQQRNLILSETRVSPLGNALVLVAPADTPLAPLTLARDSNLLALLGPNGRLAVGDPAHVPVGIYAQAALTWMGQWRALNPRLARAETVRTGLLLVERGEAPLGIVYATDALASGRVKVLGTFPAESHTAVTYPFAVTRHGGGKPQARALLAFLTGPVAAPTWRAQGFVLRAQ